jgi:hypothetical protein
MGFSTVLSPTKSACAVLPEIKIAAAKTDVALIVTLYVTDVGIKAATRHDFKYLVKEKGQDICYEQYMSRKRTWRPPSRK